MSASLIFFHLGGLQYAVNLTEIQSIIRTPKELISISSDHESILGGIKYNSEVLPLMNLRYFLGIAGEYKPDKVLILKRGNDILAVGVDRLDFVSETETGDISNFDSSHLSYFSLVSGVHIETNTQILDTSRLFEHTDILKVKYRKREECQSQNETSTYLMFVLGGNDVLVAVSNVYKILTKPQSFTTTRKSDYVDGSVLCGNVHVPLLSRKLLLPNHDSKNSLFEESNFLLFLNHGEHKICLPIDSFVKFVNVSNSRSAVMNKYNSNDIYEVLEEEDKNRLILNVDKIFKHEEIDFSIRYVLLEYGSEENKEETVKDGKNDNLLIFKLKLTFGLNLKIVEEIIEVPEDVLVPPSLDPQFYGLYNLRGKIVHILDVGRYYNIEGGNSDRKDRKIIIIQRGGRYIGLMIDQLVGISKLIESDVLDIPSVMLNQYTSPLKTEIDKVFEGASKNLVHILDSERFLSQLMHEKTS